MNFFNEDEIYEYILNIDTNNTEDIVDISLKENKINYNEITDFYYIYTKEIIEKNL